MDSGSDESEPQSNLFCEWINDTSVKGSRSKNGIRNSLQVVKIFCSILVSVCWSVMKYFETLSQGETKIQDCRTCLKSIYDSI